MKVKVCKQEHSFRIDLLRRLRWWRVSSTVRGISCSQVAEAIFQGEHIDTQNELVAVAIFQGEHIHTQNELVAVAIFLGEQRQLLSHR